MTKKPSFTVEDNVNRLFSNEEVKITRRLDERNARIWVMSTEELEDLHTTIGTFLADG